MCKIRRSVSVVLGIVVVTATGVAANADLIPQASSDFTYRCEMAVDPTNKDVQDLDSNGQNDFYSYLYNNTTPNGFIALNGALQT